MRRIEPPIKRLVRHVVIDGSCWRVTRGVRKDGYCQIQLTGKRAPKVLGHRLSYEHFVGPIPEGMELDHVWARGCRFRNCINPSHLEPVTRPVNIRRGTQAQRAREYYDALWENRTRCPNGHELAVVGINTDKDGHRQCRACDLQQKREGYQRAMTDPVKAARIREQNRVATARYRAKKKSSSMTDLEIYRPQELSLAASTAMERAADFTTWAPKLTSAAAIAREICQTEFVPAALRGKPAAVAAAIMAGSEMNLGPMASLMHVHIIEGRPSLSSEMQRALVLALGHKIRYREMTATRCVVDGQRLGEAEWTTVTWTMDDAKRAQLDGRQNWRHYPRRMLAARATGELCRMLFADALAGMPYSAEELEDESDDVAALTDSAPAETAKPRTAQRKQRTTNAPSAQAASPVAAEPPLSPQAGAGGVLPPLPGEEETPDDPPGSERHKKLVGSVQGQFKRLGFTDEMREERLAVAAELAEVAEIASLNDLTPEELSPVADTLARCRNRDALTALLVAKDKAKGGVPDGD